jgi:hypothetical protein
MLDEGIAITFGSWICVANGSGGFNGHLADSRKPETSTSASSRDVDDFADDLGGIQISDLIGSYASHIRATPRPLITSDDLIIGIDQVDDNIDKCIMLAEDALQQHGDSKSLTQNHSEAHHHHAIATDDISSSIH